MGACLSHAFALACPDWSLANVSISPYANRASHVTPGHPRDPYSNSLPYSAWLFYKSFAVCLCRQCVITFCKSRTVTSQQVYCHSRGQLSLDTLECLNCVCAFTTLKRLFHDYHEALSLQEKRNAPRRHAVIEAHSLILEIFQAASSLRLRWRLHGGIHARVRPSIGQCEGAVSTGH